VTLETPLSPALASRLLSAARHPSSEAPLSASLERSLRRAAVPPPAMAAEDDEPDDEQEPDDRCSNPNGHKWNYTGTQYGGDDDRWNGEGRVLCVWCGADGDA